MITTNFSLHSPRLLDILLSYLFCLEQFVPLFCTNHVWEGSCLYQNHNSTRSHKLQSTISFLILWVFGFTETIYDNINGQNLFSLCYEGLKLKG